MSYQIFYDGQPRKYLKKLEKDIALRIIDKIESILTINPIPKDAKPVVGEHGVFRMRIGDHRALYRVDYKQELVIIFKIEKRSRVY